MTDTDTTTEPTAQSTWEAHKDIWVDQNPDDGEAAKDIISSTRRIRVVRTLSQLTGDQTAVKSMTLGARYTSTVYACTVSQAMNRLVASLDDLEVDDSVKSLVAEYMGSLVTITSAAMDGAVRNTEGKDPGGEGSFTKEMRDLYTAKREAAGAPE